MSLRVITLTGVDRRAGPQTNGRIAAGDDVVVLAIVNTAVREVIVEVADRAYAIHICMGPRCSFAAYGAEACMPTGSFIGYISVLMITGLAAVFTIPARIELVRAGPFAQGAYAVREGMEAAFREGAELPYGSWR